MINSAVFLGQPLTYQAFKIYPPTVNQVVTEENYGYYSKILTMSQEEIEDELVENHEKGKAFPTPLEFLLANCYSNKAFEKISKDAFQFFFHEEAFFLYELKTIALGNLEEIKEVKDLKLISEDNFFDIQNKIREAIGQKIVEKPNPNEHPRIKAMKAKARLRDRIKAKKGDGINLSTSLVAICCMGIGITPLNVGEMSYAAVGELISMYQEKEKYQIDIDSLLAGADSKKIKPKYWIRNLD